MGSGLALKIQDCVIEISMFYFGISSFEINMYI